MSALSNPAFIEAEQKVRGGVSPNFVAEHVCPTCGQRFLCPDRYISERCEPTAYEIKMGWTPGNKFGCTPCNAQLSEEERARWYSVHGVKRR